MHAAYWKYAVRRRLAGDKRGSFQLTGSNWFPRPRADADLWRQDVRLLDDPRRLRRTVGGSTTALWYLQNIAIPGAPVFARLVLAGELAVGLAMLAGFQVRLAAVAGPFMVMNFHFAMGVLLHWAYLWNGYGPPVLGSLLALGIGGGELPLSIRGRGSRWT